MKQIGEWATIINSIFNCSTSLNVKLTVQYNYKSKTYGDSRGQRLALRSCRSARWWWLLFIRTKNDIRENKMLRPMSICEQSVIPHIMSMIDVLPRVIPITCLNQYVLCHVSWALIRTNVQHMLVIELGKTTRDLYLEINFRCHIKSRYGSLFNHE